MENNLQNTSELKYIGEGTGRVVYDLENGYVVKVAKNKKGIAQNEVEFIVSSNDSSDIFAKIINASEDFKYVVMEKAEPIKDLTSVWNHFEVKNNRQFYNSNYLENISTKHHLNKADLTVTSSWGLVNGVPKIIDYGLNHQVFLEHYLKERSLKLLLLILLIKN